MIIHYKINKFPPKYHEINIFIYKTVYLLFKILTSFWNNLTFMKYVQEMECFKLDSQISGRLDLRIGEGDYFQRG